MSYYYFYYKEIKNRFFLILFSFINTLLICYFYKETLLLLLVNSSSALNFFDTNFHFIFTNVTEIFYVYTKLILFVSNQLLVVTIIYHIIVFLSPGLYSFEYKNLVMLLKFFVLSLTFSIVLLNKLLLPLSFEFFLSFQKQVIENRFINLFFEAKLVEFLDFYINLYYISLFNCQFILLLSKIINYFSYTLNSIKLFRRFFYYGFVMFSTLITPPDVFSQLFLSFIFVNFYEFFIFFNMLKNFNKVTS